MERGKFIVVDGPDGSGKSTLTALLADELQRRGLAVIRVREPGGTRVAEAARAIVLNPDLVVNPRAELFLYLTARADHVATVIEPALEQGTSVISDRFELSTFAYQVEGRGLPADAVRASNTLATGGLEADLSLVIDLPPASSRRRLEGAGKQLDRLDEAGSDLHTRVDKAFRNMSGPSIVHIDGSGDAAQVLAAALRHVDRLLG